MPTAATNPSRTRVLHMLGSPASDYYAQLSTMYARGCVGSNEASCADEFEFVYAVVHPDGPSFSFPSNLEPATMEAATKYSRAEGVAQLALLNADICQSHMFCHEGVSTYRAILDLLDIPFVGGSVAAMSLTEHKGRSRAVLQSAGVPVAEGEILRRGDRPTIPFPLILKPASEDNSMGLSVVRSAEEVDAALETAFEFDEEVVCERFIPPGREIRFAVLEDEHGAPTITLPAVEYFMSEAAPVRTSNDKLERSSDGKLTFAAPARKCPADVDDALRAKLSDAVCKAHLALGCRDYSLYDFRIDNDGEIYMLEASLFCCFAPNSVIAMMADASGDASLKHQALFKTLLRRAAERKVERAAPGAVQAFGSKPKTKRAKTAAGADASAAASTAAATA